MAAREISLALWQGIEQALSNGNGLDYGDLLDLGERAGLLRQEPYDPDTHGDSTEGCEPGDPWFVTTELAVSLKQAEGDLTFGG